MANIGVGIGVPFTKSLNRSPVVNPDFISIWDTTQAGSASDTVVLPLLSGGTYSGTIDWGDGSTSALSYANRSHTYAAGGTYTITISGSDIQGWRFANGGDRIKILDVSNWGNLTITTDQAFFGCSNLNFTATDAPNITTTSMLAAFRGCASLNANIGNWNVETVTDMRSMFFGCTIFNNGGIPSINNWNTSNVTTMGGGTAGMFYLAKAFNQPINNWDMSGVLSIREMFRDADAYDQSMAEWDVTAITSANSFMLIANGLSTDNYNSTLVGWEATLQTAYPGGVGYPYTININFGGSQYTLGGAAGAARTSLILTFGWTITDGGGV